MDITNYIFVTVMMPLVGKLAEWSLENIGIYLRQFYDWFWLFVGYNTVSVSYTKIMTHRNSNSTKDADRCSIAGITEWVINNGGRGHIMLRYKKTYNGRANSDLAMNNKNSIEMPYFKGKFKKDGFIVVGEVDEKDTDSDKFGSSSSEKCTVYVISRKTAVEITEWINRRKEEYIVKITSNRYMQCYYSQMPSGNVKFRQFTWPPTTTFDDIFFPMKAELISMVDRVESGNIPALRIILYGPPGTGKTSVIRAIAEKTKRSVFAIDLNLINSGADFDDLFRGDVANCTDYYVKVKPNQRIIVLEDIDSTSKVILKRTETQHGIASGESTTKELSSVLQMAIKTNKSRFGGYDSDNDDEDSSQPKKSTLTLSNILNTLDGLAALNGPIVVITTNRYEELDPALCRPQRIDMSLHMAEMEPEDIARLTARLLGESVEMPPGATVTPAVITTVAKIAGRDPVKFHKYLTDPKIIREYPSLAPSAVDPIKPALDQVAPMAEQAARIATDNIMADKAHSDDEPETTPLLNDINFA